MRGDWLLFDKKKPQQPGMYVHRLAVILAQPAIPPCAGMAVENVARPSHLEWHHLLPMGTSQQGSWHDGCTVCIGSFDVGHANIHLHSTRADVGFQ
ncbi:MAG: hypothetical protein U0941_20325 [Planctomycetaceae bacterium]